MLVRAVLVYMYILKYNKNTIVINIALIPKFGSAHAIIRQSIGFCQGACITTASVKARTSNP